MLPAIDGEKACLPSGDAHRFAASEGRQPAEPDREDGDEKDAGEEDRHGDAEHARAEDETREERVRADGAINSRREAR